MGTKPRTARNIRQSRSYALPVLLLSLGLTCCITTAAWCCPRQRPKRNRHDQHTCSISSRSLHRWAATGDNIPTSEAPATTSKLRQLPLFSAAEDLRSFLSCSDERLVEVEAYVTAKRGFGNSFCFLDATDARYWESPVQVMIKRQEFEANDGDGEQQQQQRSNFDGYMKAMVPGARMIFTGVAAPSRNNPDEALLLARRVRLVGLPRNPQHIRILLQAVVENLLDIEEVAKAANWSVSDLEEELKKATADPLLVNGGRRDCSLQSLAKIMLKSLPAEDNYPCDILMRKHDRGVYTLPKPNAALQNPPPAAVSAALDQCNSNNQSIACGSLSSSFSVQDLIANSNTTEQSVVVHGWVQNRRRFKYNVTSLELVDDLEHTSSAAEDDGDEDDSGAFLDEYSEQSELWNRRLKCVLHPACALTTDCSARSHVLAPGSQVRLQGYFYYSSQQRNDASGAIIQQLQPLLWITGVKLLRASWRPSVVRHLIELVFQNKFAVQEARDALRRSDTEMQEILDTNDLTARQWKAAEISADLQNSQSRVAAVTPAMVSVLNDFESLRAKYPVESVVEYQDFSQSDNMREGSRWKRKKEPQLIWMAQQVKEAVVSHPAYGTGRPLRVLDVGGGKGYLANHLAKVLGDAISIQVIDVAQGAIKNGAMRSKRLQLPVDYTVGDASKASFQVDLVVALHACGALTDVAMGHATDNGAAFVICPCCFKSNPLLKVSSYKGGQRRRMPVDQWLAVDPSRYDLLKLTAEVQGDISLANEAIHSICALRAAAIEARSESCLKVSIKSFPVAFSSRNFCLVGRRQT